MLKTTMKTEIMREFGEKMDNTDHELKDTLSSILDVV
jgi:hypothetical protein